MSSPPESARFLEGDPQILAEVRRVIALTVRRFGFPQGWNDDLIQEALGRVFLGLESGRFRGEAKLTTYAEKVAKFTCMEHTRHRRRFGELPASEPPSSGGWGDPDQLVRRSEEHARNFRAFAALSSECRELFVMIFVDRLSYGEVARRVGLSESTVRCRVHRCRLKGAKLRARKEKRRVDRDRPNVGGDS